VRSFLPYLITAAALLFAACGSKPSRLAIIGPKETIKLNNEQGQPVEKTVYHTIPEFQFTDQDNNMFTNKNVEGKIYVADFFFTTCPTICKDMSGHLVELQKTLKKTKDLHIVSHTVAPDYDTPEILKAYADGIGADTSNWSFVTGDKEAIYDIAFEGYYVNASEDSLAPGGFLHSEYFVLIDKEGRIRSGLNEHGSPRAVYDGTNAEHVRQLINDIKTLEKEYR
jgi:protein SCO1/2